MSTNPHAYNVFAHDGIAPATPGTNAVTPSHKAPPNLLDLPESTQELLKRVGATSNPYFQAGGAEWEKARREVMERMTTTTEFPPIAPRGRATANASPATSAQDAASTPPMRARGRPGRPKGSRARGPRGAGAGPGRTPRGGGRGSKRKRERDDSGDASDTGSDVSASYKPSATVTKSGRSIQKPETFNPAADQMSPSVHSHSRRKRQLQKLGPEGQLCLRCLRGHSPPHNQVVFCDGCNDAYHQWCHEPRISKEVVEIADKEWICGNCLHKREMENIPVETRIGNDQLQLSLEEQKQYLLALSHKTLARLLLHSLEKQPNLAIFAPNTRDTLKMLDAEDADEPLPRPEPDEHEPYPDYYNLVGDPPATYPKPGTGPVPVQATTDAALLEHMIDDNYEVFSHSYDDGTGLKPVDRSDKQGTWIQQQQQQPSTSAPAPNGRAAELAGAALNGDSNASAHAAAAGDQTTNGMHHANSVEDDVDMATSMFGGPGDSS